MKSLNAFVVGVVFAFGLVLSGMTQPSKVIGFLDFFGDWDPALAFVMGGAATTYAIAYFLIRKRTQPLFSPKFLVPTLDGLDRRLLGGSVVFGIGWGLAGFCPGPGLVSAGGGMEEGLWFTVAMLGGMALARAVLRKQAPV